MPTQHRLGLHDYQSRTPLAPSRRHATGYKTPAVCERYNIVSSGDLRDAARRLNTYAAAV
jgi:hypothetical protein